MQQTECARLSSLEQCETAPAPVHLGPFQIGSDDGAAPLRKRGANTIRCAFFLWFPPSVFLFLCATCSLWPGENRPVGPRTILRRRPRPARASCQHWAHQRGQERERALQRVQSNCIGVVKQLNPAAARPAQVSGSHNSRTITGRTARLFSWWSSSVACREQNPNIVGHNQEPIPNWDSKMDDSTASIIQDPTAFTALTKIHKKPVLDCCFSPESEQILTASEDHTVVLWNLPPLDTELHDETMNDEHKLFCYRLSDHKTPVMSVAMHEKLFISASKDGQAKLWRLVSDHSSFKQPCPEPSTYTCHSTVIHSVCLSPDAKCFATGSDKSIKIWSTECKNKMLVSLLDGHTNWIKGVQWSKTNYALLASCGDDGKLCIWDARTKVRQPPCEMISSRPKMQFKCLDWHPVFEHHIATGAQDSACVVWDLRNRKQVQVYMEHTGSVNSVAFNPGGSLLLSGSSDKTSKIFDVCEGRNLFTLKSHSAPITSVCFNATGELLATGSQDRMVTVWKRNFETVNIVLDDETDEQDDSIAELTSDPGSSIPINARSTGGPDYYQNNIYAR